jgi:PAS domain S-box-containing protein
MALLTGYEVVLLAAMLVTAGVTGYAWRRRYEPGGRFVLVYAGASVLWSASELAMSLTGPFVLKAFWFTLLFSGVIVSIPAFFFFVLVYTGRWTVVTPRNVALFTAVPGVALLLTVTNPLHGLMFADLFPIESGAGLDIAPGVAFFVWAAYSALLLLGSVALLLDTAVRVPRFYRRQITLLAVGAIAPPLGSTFRMVGLSTVDLTPVGLVVSGVALSVAISREGFLDVTPVASDIVVDTIDAAVFVIDRRDRLVDANESATELLGGRRDFVGEPIWTVLAPYPEARARYQEIVNGELTEAEVEFTGGVYNVTASRLTDHRERLLGRVIPVSDATDRKRRER